MTAPDPTARAGDRGAATVLVLALSAVLVLVGAVAAAGAVALAGRARAAAAADLAALAAASRAGEGAGAACAAATAVARANRADLESCVLSGGAARVLVAVPLPGRLEPLGPARGAARAARVLPGTGEGRRSSDRGPSPP